MVQRHLVGKSRYPETGNLYPPPERRRRGGAFDGYITGSGLQRRDKREGESDTGSQESVQWHEAREPEPIGEETGGGVEGAGKGRAVDVRADESG